MSYVHLVEVLNPVLVQDHCYRLKGSEPIRGYFSELLNNHVHRFPGVKNGYQTLIIESPVKRKALHQKVRVSTSLVTTSK